MRASERGCDLHAPREVGNDSLPATAARVVLIFFYFILGTNTPLAILSSRQYSSSNSSLLRGDARFLHTKTKDSAEHEARGGGAQRSARPQRCTLQQKYGRRRHHELPESRLEMLCPGRTERAGGRERRCRSEATAADESAPPNGAAVALEPRTASVDAQIYCVRYWWPRQGHRGGGRSYLIISPG